jgi:hypothetical protein
MKDNQWRMGTLESPVSRWKKRRGLLKVEGLRKMGKEGFIEEDEHMGCP